MTSLRKQIRDEVMSELNAETLPDGVPEARGRRWWPGDEDPAAQINVFTIDEPVDIVGGSRGALARRRMNLGVQCVISTPTPGASDDLLDPLLDHVVSRLGQTDLNKLATDVQEQKTTWEYAKLNRYYLSATTIYSIDYQSKRNDLAKKQ